VRCAPRCANPILGVGAGAFEWRYPRYASVGYTRAAHSTYLELAAEAGLPALALSGRDGGRLAGARVARRAAA
jgi:hypothetical protein